MTNRRSPWVRIRSTAIATTLVAASFGVVPARAAGPQPGEVYREFTIVMKSGTWRVTDPDATHPGTPGNSPADFLPNSLLPLDLPPGGLTGAVRAELLIDMWGGHVGTTGQRFRFNNHAWLAIGQPKVGTPTAASPAGNPECYTQQWNPIVAVPLQHLNNGSNILEGTSGGQTCFNFGWGQWGWYAATLRIYYNPSSLTHPTGTIASPASGSTFGEHPEVRAAVQSPRPIRRIDFLARYNGPDVDGDGEWTEYHESWQREKAGNILPISGHVGSALNGQTSVIWNTDLVPDQPPGSVRLVARICDDEGVCFVTPEATGLTFERTDTSVLLFRAEGIPQRYWVRDKRLLSSYVEIPPTVNLARAVSARLLVRTWNGIDGHSASGDIHYTKVNGWQTSEFGQDHFYSYDVVEVPPDRLVAGRNTITFYSTSKAHGIEILWPTPELVVAFDGTQPRCGDGITDFGEECDREGDAADCDADCTLPECGDGHVNLAAGEECDDGNRIDADACRNDCTPPAPVTCGNGTLDAGEECDDGTQTAGCDGDCTRAVCGDGWHNPVAGETCDDGNLLDGDACTSECTLPPTPLAPARYGFEGAGPVIEDASDQANHGQLAGAARDSAGRFGSAIRFDGTSGHVSLGTLDISGNQLTLMAWIRADDFGIHDGRIVSKTTSPDEQDHYWMLSTIDSNGIRLRARVKTATQGTVTAIASGATILAGAWTHVAATYDGTRLRLFQNGVEVGSVPLSGPVAVSQDVPVAVGDNPGGTRTFDGLIDEVRIEPIALSASQIRDRMLHPVVAPAGCTGDEQCDDGIFCNGEETCQSGECVPAAPPSCDDGIGCTDDRCEGAEDRCVHTPLHEVCDNGSFCDGVETCDPGAGCVTGPAPCGDGACDEAEDVCPTCSVDADCDDGLYCNGIESCSDGECVAGAGDPCAGTGGTCDERLDTCVGDALPRLEAGTVTVGVDPATIDLQQLYASPVVICTVRYFANTLPVVPRVDEVRPGSFRVRLQGAGHDVVRPDRVDWIVVEEGVWNLDGARFEAARFLSTVTDHKRSWVGEQRELGQAYEQPVVLGQVQTLNDPRWSVFWSRGAEAGDPASPTELWAGKTVGEDAERDRAAEWIGYVVFETAHGALRHVEYEAGVGADTIQGIVDGAPFVYPFERAFDGGSPGLALTAMAGMDGANGGWVQVHGVDETALYLSVDEDVCEDGERSHITEQAGYLALESGFAFPGGPRCSARLPHEEAFEAALSSHPENWVDSWGENDMKEVEKFFVYTVVGESSLGTRSRADDLYSHYTGPGSAVWTDYRYRGRMLLADRTGGIGVTLFSAGPFEEHAYRLRRNALGRQFRIDAAGTSLTCDVPTTGVNPLDRVWYEFAVAVHDLGDRTEVLAKVWPEGSPEPDLWQQRCEDTSARRLTHGTIGVWSDGYAGKYWDRLQVECDPLD